MSKPFRLLSKSSGLNNKVSPTNIIYDERSGIGDLCVAVNVDITNEGKIARRSGTTITAITSNVHSLFTGINDTYFVSGSVLYALNPDYTATSLVTGLTSGFTMAYCDVLDRTYYCNTRQKGYIRHRSNNSWTAGTYVGPTTYRTYSDPPIGSLLGLYRGRMYVVKDNTLWYSEPFAYSMFDMARSYVWFEQNITSLLPVEDGLYVSADKVYFLKGTQPVEFALSTVSAYPVVGQTGVVVQGENLLDKSYSGKCAIWTSQDGIFLGFGNGQVKNLTKDKLDLPPIGGGCAVYHKEAYTALLRE